MKNLTTLGKSGVARVLEKILITLNNRKLNRKIVKWLNGQFTLINKILKIPDTSTRLIMLNVFNCNFCRITKHNPDIIITNLGIYNLGIYTDPCGRQSDAAIEIKNRMFALVSEKIRDGMRYTKSLIDAGIKETMRWQLMATAPRNGEHILLFTQTWGIVEAYYHSGEWDNNFESPEHSGPAWICADDHLPAIEIETYKNPTTNKIHYYDGSAKAWMPKPSEPIFEDDIVSPFKFDYNDTVQMHREIHTSLPFEKCSTTGIIVERWLDDLSDNHYVIEIKVNDYSTSLVTVKEEMLELFKEENNGKS